MCSVCVCVTMCGKCVYINVWGVCDCVSGFFLITSFLPIARYGSLQHSEAPTKTQRLLFFLLCLRLDVDKQLIYLCQLASVGDT